MPLYFILYTVNVAWCVRQADAGPWLGQIVRGVWEIRPRYVTKARAPTLILLERAVFRQRVACRYIYVRLPGSRLPSVCDVMGLSGRNLSSQARAKPFPAPPCDIHDVYSIKFKA